MGPDTVSECSLPCCPTDIPKWYPAPFCIPDRVFLACNLRCLFPVAHVLIYAGRKPGKTMDKNLPDSLNAPHLILRGLSARAHVPVTGKI